MREYGIFVARNLKNFQVTGSVGESSKLFRGRRASEAVESIPIFIVWQQG